MSYLQIYTHLREGRIDEARELARSLASGELLQAFDQGQLHFVGQVPTAPFAKAPRTQKTRKPKEKCPVNRTHEWYVEDIFTTDVSYYPLFADIVTKKVERTYLKRKATCIHCWKEKLIRRPRRRYWRPVRTKVTEIAPRQRPYIPYRYR